MALQAMKLGLRGRAARPLLLSGMPLSSIACLLFVIRAAECFEVASWSLAAAAQILPQWLPAPPTPSPTSSPLLYTEDEVMALINRAARPPARPVDGRELSEVSPPASNHRTRALRAAACTR